MKNKLFALVALALFTAGLRAEDAAPSYSLSSDFTYTTRYFFRGILQQKGALQPSVSYSQGALSLGAWSSLALEDKSATWSDGKEVDLYGSYSFALGHGYSAAVGGTAYLYPSARSSFGEPDSTYEGSFSVSGPLGPLIGKVGYFHDFVLKANTLQFDLGYSKPLSDGKAQFDAGVYYGLNDIGDGNGDLPGKSGYDYDYYGVDVALSGKISERATVKIGAHWANVSDLPQADTKVWFTVGLTVAL